MSHDSCGLRICLTWSKLSVADVFKRSDATEKKLISERTVKTKNPQTILSKKKTFEWCTGETFVRNSARSA